MYFDPVSSWLVILLANAPEILSEKLGGDQSAEYYRENLALYTKMLNAEIRAIKDKTGIDQYPDMTLERIQRSIRSTQNVCSAIKYGYGKLIIDPDNQEYIVNLIAKCAEQYRELERKYVDNPVRAGEYRKKAESYENTVLKARDYWKKQALQMEEERILQEKTGKSILCLLGVFIILIIIFFSSVIVS